MVDERTLREIYLPPYEGAVKLGHTAAVMGAFNKVNGDFACQSLFLITNVLKQDWGFLRIYRDRISLLIMTGYKQPWPGLDLDMPGGTLHR